MNKRVFLVLSALISLLGGRCFATDYDLWVAGERVTSENATHLSNEYFPHGYARYNAETNTLTLEEVSINCGTTDLPCIENHITGLKIEVVQSACLYAFSGDCIYSDVDFSLDCGPELITGSTLGYDIHADYCDLHIVGGMYCETGRIMGSPGHTATITCDKFYLSGGIDGCSAVSGFDTFSHPGVLMENPSDGSYHDHNLYSKGEIYTGSILLELKIYPITVGYLEVTSKNADNITSAQIGSGLVRYIPETHTLILQDASISNYWGGMLIPPVPTCIEATAPLKPLTIQVYGNNTLFGDLGVRAFNCIIEGPGTLSIYTRDGGMNLTNNNLTIRGGCVVSVYATENPYDGDVFGVMAGHLIMNGGTLIIEMMNDDDDPLIIDYANLVGGAFLQPVDGYFVDGQVYSHGSPYDGKIVAIGPCDYHLWVGNTQVNSAIAPDVLGDGTVSYDNVNNVLTLNDASVNGGNNPGIYNEIPGLKIEVHGTSSVTSSTTGILSLDDFTINGQGTLNVTGLDGIWAQDCHLGVLGKCEVNATGTGSGDHAAIRGEGTNSQLTLNFSIVTASAPNASSSAICGFESLELQESWFTTPANAYYLNGSVWRQGDSYPYHGYLGDVVVEPIRYNLWVAGERVTSANASDVLGDGHVSYDSSQNKLTLNDANIHCGYKYGIQNEITGLTIVSLGNDTIISSSSGIYSTHDFTIEVNRELCVVGSTGVEADDCKLTIQGDGRMNVEGTEPWDHAGIYGSSNRSLTINHCYMHVLSASENRSAIAGFGSFHCEGIEFKTPSDATYSSGYIFSQGTTYFGEVTLSLIYYDLYVNSVLVHYYNAADILGDGHASYDASLNTLTLDNASMSCTHDGILSYIPDLTINLIGNNTLNVSVDRALELNADATIQGTGTLDATGLWGIYARCNLTIQGGCTVTTTGISGMAIVFDGQHTLTIDGSTLNANPSPGYSAIYGLPDLNLVNAAIDTPACGSYHDYAFYDSYGHEYNSSVSISPLHWQLYVAGNKVDINNASDVLGDGKVHYDYENNILTLHNANIGSTREGIANYMADLTIALEGNNTITATNSGIYSTENLTIEGTGTLNVTGDDGIYFKGLNLTIQGGCTVNAAGTHASDYSGFYGSPLSSLNIIRSFVTSNTNSNICSAIYGFGSLNLVDVGFATPTNASYHDRGVYSNGDFYIGQVVVDAAYYNLWVAETQVTSLNAADVTGNGNISYDAASNTLLLDNAYITGGNLPGIKNQIPGLKILVQGYNDIHSSSSGIQSTQDFSIEGTGELNVTGNDGIYASNCNLTIQGGCTLSLFGTGSNNYAGIYGSQSKTLTLRNCQVTARTSSGSLSAIYGFGTLNLDIVDFASPAGGYYQNRQVYNSQGEVYYGEIVINTAQYDLYVSGHRVSMANADDVLGDGKVSYDADSKILTLTNATIDAGSYQGIENHIPGLKIRAQGTNTIISASSGISSDYSFTIEGTGTLNVTGSKGIHVKDCYLTIQGGCTVNATGTGSDGAGIYGTAPSTLTIRQSTVTASTGSLTYTAIYGFHSLTLDEVGFETPFDACYHDQKVYRNGNTYAGQVTIRFVNYQLYLGNVRVTTSNYNNIVSSEITGTASFDPVTHTLTLHNAHIITSESMGVDSHLPDLIIQVEGDNIIHSPISGISTYENCTIEGPGTLYATANDGIVAYKNLTIQGGVTIETEAFGQGDYAGIYGYGTNAHTLTIDHGFVTASNNSTIVSAITGFDEIQFNYSHFLTPADGIYQNGNVYSQGNLYLNDIEIGAVEYNLVVGDTRVTSGNENDVLGDGHVSYDDATKTLTLNNANISSSLLGGIQNSIPNLKIVLVGTNVITASALAPGIQSDENFSIEGTGTITVSGNYGIYADDCNLTIQGGCRVNATGTNSSYAAICGSYSKTLTISESVVTAGGSYAYNTVLTGFGTLNLDGVGFVLPSNGTYDDGDVYVQNNLYTGQVVIGILYDLKVAGTQVTSVNASDVLGDGKVSYDAENNVLTLNGATVNGSGYYGISNKIADLTIYLIGTNTVTSRISGIFSNKNLTIDGTGTLNVTGNDGIYMSSSNLTIQGFCTVNATGTASGNYAGVYGSQHSLTVHNATLTATSASNNHSAIYGFSQLNFTGVGFATPSDGYYQSRDVYSQGASYHGQIVIEIIHYDLYVRGVNVTSFNAGDILQNGKVSYDPITNTLTLNDASINAGDEYGIYNQIPNLTISVQGYNNVVMSSTADGICSMADFSIGGIGSLYASGVDGILAVDCDLSIVGGCRVNAVGKDVSGCAPIRGSSSKTLSIVSSCVTARFQYNMGSVSSILGFGSLNLSCVEFTSPANGTYQNAQVYSQGAPYMGEVMIESVGYDLWVSGVRVTSGNVSDVLGDGKVNYNSSSNVLTLNGVAIDAGIEEGIKNQIPDLTIVLEGQNTIASTNTGIYSAEDFVMEGTGSLIVTGENGIWAYGGDLTIQGGCTIHAIGTGEQTNAGIRGYDYHTLTIDGCIITAENNTIYASAISGFDDLNMTGVDFASPADGVYEYGNVYAGDSYDIYLGTVEIGVVSYNLGIAGTTVTTQNAVDVFGDGTVSYNYKTKTLLLQHVQINTTSVGISNGIPGLTIALVGDDNSIVTTSFGINSTTNFSIQGPGSLNVAGDSGISAIDCDLSIRDNCTLNVVSTGMAYNTAIGGSSNRTLTIVDSHVTATSNTNRVSPIHGFGTLNLNQVGFLNPSYGTYQNGDVVSEGTLYTNQVSLGRCHALRVAGIRISDINRNDVFGDGTVSYNSTNRVLTLNGANITDDYHIGVDNSIEGLTILLIGHNTITSGNSGIWSVNDFTIEGAGTLSVTGSTGICAESCHLTIQGDCQISAVATNASCSGIMGDSSSQLTINQSSVTANTISSSVSAVSGFGTLNLIQVDFATPLYTGYYQNNNVYDQEGVFHGEVTIQNVNYDLWVDGHRVTTLNASDVLDDGTVNFDRMSKTLTLDNTSIYGYNSTSTVLNRIPGLTLHLSGTNSVYSSYNTGVTTECDMTIEGPGSLAIYASNYGINALSGELIIQGCTLTSIGNLHEGICGNGSLTIIESSVTASCDLSSTGAISGFTALNFEQVDFITPNNGSYHNQVYDEAGNEYHGTVRIGNETYNLWVDGTRVCTSNKNDVLGDGKVRFNHETSTLTLNAVHINAGVHDGINNNITGLTIELEGTSSISSQFTGIHSSEDCSIKGNGSLIVSGLYAILGKSSKTLSIDTSSVIVNSSATSSSAISGFSTLILNGVRFITPVDGVYHDGNVYSAESLYTEHVEIGNRGYDLWVAGVQVTPANAGLVHGDGSLRKTSYDPVAKVLTLKNEQIYSETFEGIRNEIPGLTIALIGTTEINSALSGIYSSEDLSIVGQGSISVKGEDGIFADGADLTLQDIFQFLAQGRGMGNHASIRGSEGHTVTVHTCDYAYAQISESNNSEVSAITGFSNLELVNMSVYAPNEGFSYHDQNAYCQGNLYWRAIDIRKIQYDLFVRETRVDCLNAYDVLNDGGTVSYDPENNVLTLNNASLEQSTWSTYRNGCIDNFIEGLTIALVGTNSINSWIDGIHSSQNFSIEGTGTLNLTSQNSCINASHCDLVIQGGCTINAVSNGSSSSYEAGISGSSSNYTLTIDHSYVTSYNSATTRVSAIHGFKSLTLNGVGFVTPDWEVSYQDGDVYCFDSRYTGVVEIGDVDYNLWVKGTQVTSSNAHDVLGDGTVSYNIVSNVLTLNGTDISSGFRCGISNRINDLTIELIGSNSITSVEYPCILSMVPLSIIGSGSLDVTGAIGIRLVPGNLTISGGCSVTATSTSAFAICGEETDTLFINQSHVIATSNKQISSAIAGFGTLSLHHAYFITPVDGVYDHGVYVNEEEYTGQIEIGEHHNIFLGTVDNLWSKAANWSDGILPNANSMVYIDNECLVDISPVVDDIVIRENGDITVPDGSILKANTIDNAISSKLVIEDGGQLFFYNDYYSPLAGTLTKNITGYGNDNRGHFNFLSPPCRNSINITESTNLTTGNYDLYSYNESIAYWINYKQSVSQGLTFSLSSPNGYLYANHDDITVRMAVNINGNSSLSPSNLGYLCYMGHSGEILPGFHLVGNPYTCDANLYLYVFYSGPETITDFYKLNAAGNEVVLVTGQSLLHPMEAVFVQMQEPYKAVSFHAAESGDRGMSSDLTEILELSVSQGEGRGSVLNNVLVHFDHSLNVSKLMLDEHNTRLSIVSEGQEYGSFCLDGQDKLQLNFKASEEGTYTLSLGETNRGVVLVDTLTGVETNLGQGDYTFKASPDDSAERFVIKF